MLGRDVVAECRRRGLHVDALDRTELDITDASACGAVLASLRPTVVINCAAYTDVNAAEAERRTAFQVNAVGAGYLARAAHAVQARCIYLSTDYVFDGTKSDPYEEDDPPCPINAYGASKLAGEHRTMAETPTWTIVRTSWLFGRGGRNFVETILERGRGQATLDVVCDQWGAPTYTRDLAPALVDVALAHLAGILHLTGTGYCSWYEFACAIVEAAGLGGVEIRPVPSERYPTPARRPANSRLLDRRARAAGVSPRPHWRDALARFLTELNDPTRPSQESGA